MFEVILKWMNNNIKFKRTRKTLVKVLKKSSEDDMTKRMKSKELTIFLMRTLGLWHTNSTAEKVLSNILLSGVLTMMLYSECTQFTDLYYAIGSLAEVSIVAPTLCLATTELFKMLIFIKNRAKVMRMNQLIDENIWRKEYNKVETTIFNYYDAICTKAIKFYIFLGQCVVWSYLLIPIFGKDSHGKRKLPFTIPFNKFLSFDSPYYELFYIVESLGAMSVFFGTVAFASYMFSISLFTAAQFKMLSQKLTTLCDFESPPNRTKSFDCQSEVQDKLKQCILTHQKLISLIKEVENLYCYILLGQLIGSVIEICLSGLQILFVATTPQRNIVSFNLLLTCTLQLYLFCYSSHKVYFESENIAQAVYSMKWYRITHPRIRKDFSLSLQIIVYRARRPCVLRVGKFYPLTLSTFASVLRTSLSYFAVLREIIQ